MPPPKPDHNFLSGEWMNRIFSDVLNQVDELLVELLDKGLFSSGYLPLEQPASPDLVRRMTAEQFQATLGAMDDDEDKEALLGMLDNLTRPKEEK